MRNAVGKWSNTSYQVSNKKKKDCLRAVPEKKTEFELLLNLHLLFLDYMNQLFEKKEINGDSSSEKHTLTDEIASIGEIG